MKISITINDLSKGEAQRVLDILNEGQNQPVPVAYTTDEAVEDEVAGDKSGVDVNNLPWDARIHSSNGKKSKDGSWQKRRGVQEQEVQKVEAELRAASVPVAFTAPAAPVAPTFVPPTPPTALDINATLAAYAAPVPPVVPVAAPAPIAPAPIPAPSFVQQTLDRTMSALLGRLQRAGSRIDTNFVSNTLVGGINLAMGTQFATVVDVSTNPAALEMAHTILDQNGL